MIHFVLLDSGWVGLQMVREWLDLWDDRMLEHFKLLSRLAPKSNFFYPR